MGEFFFANADKIAAHKRFHEKETRLAEELLAEVKMLGQYPEIQADDRYRQVIRQINKLLAFTRGMEDFSEMFSDRVLQASKQIGSVLKKAGDSVRF